MKLKTGVNTLFILNLIFSTIRSVPLKFQINEVAVESLLPDQTCQTNVFIPKTLTGNPSPLFELTFFKSSQPYKSYSLKAHCGTNPEETCLLKAKNSKIQSKFFQKYGQHCVKIIFQINTPLPIINLLHYGHPAEENFVFVSEKTVLERFISQQGHILNKIKYKFAAIVPGTDSAQLRGDTISERASLELKFIGYTSGKLNIVSKTEVKGTKILKGTHLQGSALFAPYMIRKNSKGRIIGGMHFVFMETISKSYNFSYELEATPGRGTGHQLPNGTWTHLMGDIVHGQKDFVTVTAPTASRYGIIDMTSYTFTVNVIFYSRFPRTHVQWESIVHPFKPSLWLGVVLAFLSIVTLFYVTLRVHNGINSSKQSKAHHLYLSLMIPAAMLLDQEGNKPKCVWKVDIIWMFFVMIVGACYKDQLVGFLTLPASEPTPRTFQDLHNQNGYHLFFFYMASTPSMYFKSTANPIHRALFSRFEMIRSGQKCVMKAAVTERSVCVGLDNQLAAAVASNLTIKTQFQPLILSQEKLIPFFACFGLPINSVYTDAFDQISLATTESGLGGKWYQDSLDFLKRGGKSWLTNDMKDTDLFRNVRQILLDREGNVKPLEVKHFKAIWGVGCVGITLAIVSFGFECLRLGENPSNSQINEANTKENMLFFPFVKQTKKSLRISMSICKMEFPFCPKIPTYPKL